MSDDLAGWLLEQIAEDDRRLAGDSGDWHTALCGYAMGEYGDTCSCDVADRVLAECDAKRRIIALHTVTTRLVDVDDDDEGGLIEVEYCQMCAAGASCECCTDEEDRVWPCEHLKLLALPYADRPGYLEEWKP